MKIKKNEKFVLKFLLEDPAIGNSQIAKKLGITSQAVGKIRKQLSAKGYIKRQEVILDYEKLGIRLHAIALIRILPKALKAFKQKELDRILHSLKVLD